MTARDAELDEIRHFIEAHGVQSVNVRGTDDEHAVIECGGAQATEAVAFAAMAHRQGGEAGRAGCLAGPAGAMAVLATDRRVE